MTISGGRSKEASGWRVGSSSVARVVLAVLVIVVIVELAIMLVFLLLPELPRFTAALVDALALAAFSAPLIWMFVVKPLQRAVVEREEELHAQNARLTRSNQELKEFVFIASHDLKSPIRTVVSSTDVLVMRNPDLDEESLECIHRAQRASHKMQTLIEDLLAYSQVTANPLIATRVPTGDVVAEIIDDWSEPIKAVGATVTVTGLPDVAGEASQIRQLFSNLLENAFKYAGDRAPLIEISATAEPGDTGWWQFAIIDNGIGFDNKFAEQVFAMFQRLHSADEYPGTGMGLAICKRVVDRHGGRIWAQSQPGVGTTIRFTLKGYK